MATQRHTILRQVIEVRGCSPETARAVQSELSRAFHAQLLPAIERACSELSSPHRIDRIGSLEIDLGELSEDALAAGFVEKFEPAFRSRLASAIEAVVESTPAADAQLELLGHFIRTGTLPWWADRSPGVLDACVQDLIRRNPQAVRDALSSGSGVGPARVAPRAIDGAPDSDEALRRVVRTCPPAVLDEVACALSPAVGRVGAGKAWTEILEAAYRALGVSAGELGNAWWEELLRAAVSDTSAGKSPSNRADFFHTILARIARRGGVGYGTLVAELDRAREGSATDVPSPVGEIIARLARESGRPSTSSDVSPPAQADRQEADAFDVSRTANDRNVARNDGSANESESRNPVHPTKRSEPADPAKNRSIDRSFSDADTIGIDNSGLVVLWPFLPTFFERLGLVEEKQFRDEAAAHRAAGLLQFVATGDTVFPEYLLPLNKLLCGLPVEAVFDFGPEITEREIDECDDLLTAAIVQAPILNGMSIGGFRASFLLRAGRLGARDDHWLLRVERVTHDVVLDRFPWSVNFVRMPWMKALMQVEW